MALGEFCHLAKKWDLSEEEKNEIEPSPMCGYGKGHVYKDKKTRHIRLVLGLWGSAKNGQFVLSLSSSFAGT